VVVVVRPEELVLGGHGAGGAPFDATVLDVAFLGAQRTVRLESAAVGDLVASTRAGADPLARGEEVSVSWPDEQTWAVPAQN
jgi:ABC-type Fe3+/spermidine/putrescine transport system ATPase subunit